MNSPAVSPDRGSTLVLIDDGNSSSAPDRPQTSSQVMPSHPSSVSSFRTGILPGPSSTHPPDPLLYGLQTMEWRPWLRSMPGSSSSVDEYTTKPTTNDDYANYHRKGHFDYDPVPLDMHGVGSVRHSLRWWGKVLWTFLLLASTAGLSYQSYKTIRQFWSSGSSISGSYAIEQSTTTPIRFPDVYVCPTNPINETHRRRRRTDTKWYQMLSALQQKANPDGILGKQFVNWDYFSQPSISITNPPTENQSDSPWLPTLDQQSQSSIPEDTPSVDPAPSPLNIDFMREYFMHNGYDTDQFLVECSFRSKSFKCSDVAQQILDRTHGKCFLFPFSSGNWAWPNTITSSSGPLNSSWGVWNGGHSFSVAMNIHTELYPRENGSLHDGVYLYIDWRSDPASSFQRKPLLLPPGAYSSISLEAREIRMSQLDPDCEEEEPVDDRRGRQWPWMVLNSPQYYREDLCRFDCLLQSIIDYCHCVLLIDGRYINRSALIVTHSRGNETDQSSSHTTSPFTNLGYCTVDQLNGCVYDLLREYDSQLTNEYNSNNCTRRCRPSCRLKEYALVSNTYLKLPAESYLGSGPNYPYPWNELKNNYVILDIVLEKGRRVVIEQETAMKLETFLGIVGGQMSFFLGCSVLTIVQIIVVVLSCCMAQCQRVYRGKCLTLRKTLRKMRHSSLLK